LRPHNALKDVKSLFKMIVENQKIKVRKFSPADLKHIIEIERSSFAIDAFSKFTFMNFYYKRKCLFIIAEVLGVISGYMVTCIANEKGHVVSIAVSPSHRCKGIGKALVNYTLDHLKKSSIKILELEVRTTNLKGIGFWEKMGFYPLNIISHYYHDGTAALEMRKLL